MRVSSIILLVSGSLQVRCQVCYQVFKSPSPDMPSEKKKKIAEIWAIKRVFGEFRRFGRGYIEGISA